MALFSVMFLGLIGYITYIEFAYSDQYTNSQYNARNYELDTKVIRGSIYDRNNVELAFSEEKIVDVEDLINGQVDKRQEKRIVRTYPYGEMYSHVIGYVSDDYSNRTLIENEFNSHLLKTDLLSKISDKINDNTKKGQDLKLTIDHNLQQEAFKALGNYRGSIVCLNPKNGEILAMVSKPSFDPQNLDLEKIEDTSLYSRAIQMTYPPGSTYKIVTSAAIIEYGLDNEIYNDTDGKFIIESSDGNTQNNYVCHNSGKSIYGETDLNKAFRLSSNVYYAYMGAKLGDTKIQKIAGDFLLNKDINEILGFDLPIVKSRFQKDNMTDAECAMSSIGQGQTEVTPLHLALICATIANDGVMCEPKLVSDTSYKSQGKRIIKKETAKRIKDMMLDCVNNGTGTNAKIPGVEVCGKTGTSENSQTKNNPNKTHALFVGFAPYDNPEIAVCVIVENAGYGGSVAAPMCRKIMSTYFNNTK